MRLIAVIMAMTMSTAAFAQPASELALNPGRPAGVQQAQMALFGNPVYLGIGIAAIAAGIAIAASSHSSPAAPAAGGTTTTTTTTTTTSP